jgi:hypothetical protein
MNARTFLLALGLALTLPSTASALDVDVYVYGFQPRTGDGFLDTQLGDINGYARGNPDSFISDVVVSFGAPRLYVQDLYRTRRWAPGDIYYACALAYQLRRPCSEIVDIYDRDHGQGWGAIAHRLGIKPGSAAFHALKGNVGKGHGSMRGRQGNGGGKSGGQGNGPGSQGPSSDHGAPASSGKGKGGQQQDHGGQGGKGKGGQGGGKGKGP